MYFGSIFLVEYFPFWALTDEYWEVRAVAAHIMVFYVGFMSLLFLTLGALYVVNYSLREIRVMLREMTRPETAPEAQSAAEFGASPLPAKERYFYIN